MLLNDVSTMILQGGQRNRRGSGMTGGFRIHACFIGGLAAYFKLGNKAMKVALKSDVS